MDFQAFDLIGHIELDVEVIFFSDETEYFWIRKPRSN